MALVFLVSLLIPTSLVHSDSSTSAADEPEDEVTVRGKTLQGRIASLGPKGIEFVTVYGKGALSISYDDIEEVVSQRRFLVFYGQDQLARGQLLGIEVEHLVVGIDKSSAQRVPLREIETGVSQRSYDESLWTRLQTNYRYWRGSFNLGYTFEEGAVDKNKIEIGLNLRRRKKPTSFVLDFRYKFEDQKKESGPVRTTKDELEVSVAGAYDFKRPFFAFVRPAYEYDKPRNVESRWYPAAGIGYRIVETENEDTHLEFPVGIGYIDENFGGIGTNSFVSWFVGLTGSYDFGQRIILSGWVLYMPKIKDPSDDWLFRTLLEFTVPVFDPIAVKFRLTNTNDNNPTPEVGDNKFTASLFFSLVF